MESALRSCGSTSESGSPSDFLTWPGLAWPLGDAKWQTPVNLIDSDFYVMEGAADIGKRDLEWTTASTRRKCPVGTRVYFACLKKEKEKEMKR